MSPDGTWAHPWDPTRGKWKLRQVIKAFLEERSLPATEGELLRHLVARGYHPAITREILPKLIDIDDAGHVSLKRGG